MQGHKDIDATLTDFAHPRELAKEFNVSVRTIERWVRMRLLPAPVKLGRTTLHHLPTVRASLLEKSSKHSKSRRGP